MVNFIDVDPREVGTQNREGRRGRVSYPILKSFMETGKVVVKIDPRSIDKNPTYLRSVLTSYIRSHKMPIKIFSQGGELHLMRLDLDVDGNEIEWSPDEDETTEGSAGDKRHQEPKPITMEEVDARAEKVRAKSHT